MRRAAQLAVDNAAILKISLNDHGKEAANHHVGPMHAEYADIGPHVRDVEKAKALLAEAGKADHEYDLISVDVDWQKTTGDAIAAQMRDAGLKVKRTVLPAATFWNDWNKYPFSCTEWLGRPLGVQVLALAYKSGAAWNESAYANPEFDTLLDQALATPDVEARRKIMAKIEQNLARLRRHHPVLLALGLPDLPGCRAWLRAAPVARAAFREGVAGRLNAADEHARRLPPSPSRSAVAPSTAFGGPPPPLRRGGTAPVQLVPPLRSPDDRFAIAVGRCRVKRGGGGIAAPGNRHRYARDNIRRMMNDQRPAAPCEAGRRSTTSKPCLR